MNRETINVQALGAVGDGVKDDTIALQWALDRWVECANSVLVFPPGDYLTTAPLAATFTRNDTSGKAIIGDGARVLGSLSLVSRAVVRYLSVQGLSLTGGLLLDGGDEAKSQFLYGFLLDGVKCEGFSGHGIELRGCVFEGSLDKCQARAPASNTTGFGIYCNKAGASTVSSIDVWGCTTVGGLRGLYAQSPVSDIKIYGGTFIEAQQQGILLENAQSQCVFNAHVENNWKSATSIDTALAGCAVVGNALISGVTGTTNDRQRNVVSVYSTTAAPAIIIGGSGTGRTVTYARLAGQPGSQVWMLGNQSAEFDNGNVTMNRLGNGLTLGERKGVAGRAAFALPASIPAIAGSRTDGSALAATLAALQGMGLITDRSTA